MLRSKLASRHFPTSTHQMSPKSIAVGPYQSYHIRFVIEPNFMVMASLTQTRVIKMVYGLSLQVLKGNGQAPRQGTWQQSMQSFSPTSLMAFAPQPCSEINSLKHQQYHFAMLPCAVLQHKTATGHGSQIEPIMRNANRGSDHTPMAKLSLYCK